MYKKTKKSFLSLGPWRRFLKKLPGTFLKNLRGVSEAKGAKKEHVKGALFLRAISLPGEESCKKVNVTFFKDSEWWDSLYRILKEIFCCRRQLNLL